MRRRVRAGLVGKSKQGVSRVGTRIHIGQLDSAFFFHKMGVRIVLRGVVLKMKKLRSVG